MTDEERKQLREAHEVAIALRKKLLDPSPTGDPPLVVRMAAVIVVFERSNWALKVLAVLIAFTGTALGSFAAIKAGFFSK